MVGGNGRNQFRQYAWQNAGNLNGYNAEEAGIQLQAEEYDLMAAVAELDEIEEVNANCILMANLQQASTSGTQTDSAPVYDTDGSAEVHENCDDNEIFNMFTQEEQYTELLEPIPESHQNLAIEVEKVNLVNRKLKKTNADLTTELARFKNHERMTNETHNWSSSAHQELHKIVRDEIFPIVNQVDARLQNFKIQFLKEAAKFVGDFKSLANEADASLAKHKALELEIKRLLKAVVSQAIMIIIQNESVVDTSDLQTELERTKECFENCIIKKETEYAKLWNNWYKKCDECKYDKISYDKAYKDMQQKIKQMQAQLGDLKGKTKDTSSVLDTQNMLSQKLKNKNVELEFQILNYARENAHLKATYKNLFDSISVLRAQTQTIIASFQNELQSNIYKNAKLRTQLFKKVSDQKDNIQDTSENTKFVKQPIVENLPKFGKTNALSKPVTSNSVSTPQESKSVNNNKVIAPGMFRINPDKTFREAKKVPNIVSASNMTKPITVSQPPVFAMKDVNSNLSGLSSTGVDNTKTRRPQPRSNTKNDRVPSVSKSSRSKNKEAKVEEHHRNLLLSNNNKHISSASNNIKTDSQEVISNVDCAMCSKCLISVNHDKCLCTYVNDKNSRGKKQSANVSIKEKQKKQKPKVKKPKKEESHKSLATPMPRKPRSLLRWSPTRRMFDINGKIIASSESESQSDCSKDDNACTSNHVEPTIKRFPNSTFSLAGLPKFKFHKEHLCPSCEQGKSKRASHLPKPVPNSRQRLHLLYMDLCRPMRIASINGKRYVLEIVDDYSRYTWVHFLRSKDEAPEAIATACFTQNRSIIHRRFNKTPYELINGKKPDISFLHVFGALCYPKNDREDIGKLGAKGDIEFLVQDSILLMLRRLSQRNNHLK
nr:Gag-Pol polyprotein [Tanacetum cinerariifolium]